jgi:hypothetical protein
MTNTFGPSEWVAIAHDAIKDFKTARDQLPAGKRRDDLTRRIQEAEAKLSRADALQQHNWASFSVNANFPESQCCGESQNTLGFVPAADIVGRRRDRSKVSA